MMIILQFPTCLILIRSTFTLLLRKIKRTRITHQYGYGGADGATDGKGADCGMYF